MFLTLPDDISDKYLDKKVKGWRRFFTRSQGGAVQSKAPKIFTRKGRSGQPRHISIVH